MNEYIYYGFFYILGVLIFSIYLRLKKNKFINKRSSINKKKCGEMAKKNSK